jgi:hypothetical protein
MLLYWLSKTVLSPSIVSPPLGSTVIIPLPLFFI